MTQGPYEHVAQLVSRIRNARFGEMVAHTEELIDSGEWRDFTTPVGTHFAFRRFEFDYFLAAQEIDPTIIRTAYTKATGIDDLAVKIDRLADITGRGRAPVNGDRRTWRDVADQYRSDPSGAGTRIEAWAQSDSAVVTDSMSRVARTPKLRKQFESTGRLPSLKQRWHVDWRDAAKPAAQAIADKLLTDPDLAHEVWKILRNELYNAKTGKRRSAVQNGS